MRHLIAFFVPAFAVALATAPLCASAADQKAAPATSDKATKADVAKAEKDRKKPLRRCDELKDKAQLACLEKAREDILQARQKRQASGKDAAPK